MLLQWTIVLQWPFSGSLPEVPEQWRWEAMHAMRGVSVCLSSSCNETKEVEVARGQAPWGSHNRKTSKITIHLFSCSADIKLSFIAHLSHCHRLPTGLASSTLSLNAFFHSAALKSKPVPIALLLRVLEHLPTTSL